MSGYLANLAREALAAGTSQIDLDARGQRNAEPPPATYIGGLDLGQSQDYTALTILERTVKGADDNPARPVRHYAVRHLERFALGTSYVSICERVVRLFSEAPLAGGTLAIDATGVGKPVVDMIRKARPRARIVPVTITGGDNASRDGPGWRVPKRELVSVLKVLLQSGRLLTATTLPLASVLVREMETFSVKITLAANETFEAWRERDHDDILLAVAIGCWIGERGIQDFWIHHDGQTYR